MHRRGVFSIPLAALAASQLRGDPSNGDPRLSHLFSSFVAPCCWRENLLTHQSPKADELRADIRRRIALGHTDVEIKQALLTQYSGRILATPDGSAGRWLTWTPVAASAVGLAALGLILNRLRAASSPSPSPALPLPPDCEWDLWDGPPPPAAAQEKQKHA